MKRFFKGLGKLIWTLFKLLVVLGLVAGIAAGIYLYRTYAKPVLALQSRAKRIASGSRREDFSASLTSIIYDTNGERITTLRSGKDSYYLTYGELPRYALDAMLVTEDKKFYSHSGVDFVANVRAAIALVEHGGEITQGASTITQQLARMIYLSNEVTYERKIVEIFLAWELEKKYSKSEILEFYMNNIYFSNGYYGLQAAAYGYFGKSAKELSLSETVFLCAIPNSPDVYNPYTGFEKTLERRDRMLRQMEENRKITKEEYDAAASEKIVLTKQTISRHNYVETYTFYCAIRALMEHGGFTFRTEFTDDADKADYEERYNTSYAYWQKRMYTGGYRIYTSINLELQELLQQMVDEGMEEFTDVNEDGIYKMQASAACIDNATGCVVAIVGGREQEFSGYTFNRAYQSFRQPGSSIKPLVIYTPLFERGLSVDDIMLDEKFDGGPVNAGGSYSGEITVRRAVEQSKNTVAWKLFEELTPEVGIPYLTRMNFRRIVSTDYVPAAALGGLTYGVSALEMTSAYAAVYNDGIYRTPTCIARITDADGKEIISNLAKPTRIYEENAARTMTNVLQGVLTAGTAKRGQLKNAIAAGKTGTTNNKRDGWFIGYTAYYTAGVWVGSDMPKTVDSLSGSSYPLTIWHNFMEKIHEGLPRVEFKDYIPNEKTRFSSEELAAMLTPAPDEFGNGMGNPSEMEGSLGNDMPDGTGTSGNGAAGGTGSSGNGAADGTGTSGNGAAEGTGSSGNGAAGGAENTGDAMPNGTPAPGQTETPSPTPLPDGVEDGNQYQVSPPPDITFRWDEER